MHLILPEAVTLVLKHVGDAALILSSLKLSM
jgi:hypothetical protein